jgi:site-specific DNA recombinase
MKKAAFYARVSTTAQEKDRTVESQIVALKRQVAAAGDVLVKEYVDDGFSGAKLDRPAMDRLRNDLKTNLFDAIYFLGTDRIARDVVYQNIIIGEILKHGKQLVVGGRDFTKSPENDFTLTVLGAASQLERAKIIERNTRGKMHCLRQGLIHSNGHNTFGYEYVPKSQGRAAHCRINEREAKVIRHIFKAYAEENLGWAKIVRRLEDRGILTKTGKKLWDTEKLRNILRNSSYAGIKYFNSRYNEKKSTDPLRPVKYGRKIYRDKSEWIPIKVPAIVTQKLFDKAQARLMASKNTYRGPSERRLLSGMVDCGQCDRFFVSYYRTYRDPRREDPETVLHKRAYRCSRIGQQRMHSKKVSFEWCRNPEVLTHLLDGSVLDIIRETMTDPVELAKWVDLPKNANHARTEKKLKDIELRMGRLTTERKRTIDLYASGKIDRAEYAKRCRRHDDGFGKAKSERSETLRRIPALHKKDLVDASIRQFCESVQAGLAAGNDDDTLRKLVKDHIGKIIYDHGRVIVLGSVPIRLRSREDAGQESEANKLPFKIEGAIKRRWHKKARAI